VGDPGECQFDVRARRVSHFSSLGSR
jgi:hypothetical protein